MNLPSVTEIFGFQGAFDLLLVGRLLLAVALGALIGMEREIARVESGQEKIAGLRTIIFITMLGALSQLLDSSGALFLVSLVLAAVFLGGAAISNAHHDKHFGLTTPMVSLIAFLLGGMIMVGDRDVTFLGETVRLDLTLLAIFTAITVTVLLSLKQTFTRVADSITPSEFFSTLKFAIIAFVILPFLPRQPLSDYVDTGNATAQTILSALTPYNIWLLVVLISGIGFVGYVLTRIVGAKRGIGISGFLGGLVSSTAVMGAMAQKSKAAEPSVAPFIIATTIASLTSFVRVLVEVLVVNRALLPSVILPFVVMFAVGLGLLKFLPADKKRAAADSADVEHHSPFTLGPALKFTALIVVVKVLVKLASGSEIPGAIYGLALVSGLADVDALTLSVASEARNGLLENGPAATAIVLATLANMTSKAGIAMLFGSRSFGRKTALIFAGVIVAGLAMLPFVARG